MNLRFSALLGLLLTCFCANAQQQAPPQHSPATNQYAKPKSNKAPEKPRSKEVEEKVTSVVTIHWSMIPLANRYVLSIARDPEFNTTFFTVETADTAYTTPELPPGPYYYQVSGFEDERAVGKTTAQRIVVAKPLTLTSENIALPAPMIVQPRGSLAQMPFYPAYGKIRLAWEAVDGARGYRVRLWSESKAKENARWKKETPPRWITEVREPWIEVRDAPYSSYMYLDTGIYRWDVAAVDKGGGQIGDTSSSYFEVSRQWYIKEEIYFRPYYAVTPSMTIEQSSSLGSAGVNSATRFSSVSQHFGGELDWFFLRQLGFNFGLGTQTFGPEPTTFSFFHMNFDVLYRHYLSTHANGWTFIGSLGMGMQEYPQIDNIGVNPGDLHISRPKGLGARVGLRFSKRWDSPWELQFRTMVLLQAFTLSAPTGNGTTQGSFNGDFSVEALRHYSDFFALGFGLTAESRKLAYLPSGNSVGLSPTSSKVSFSGLSAQLRLQFHW